MAALDVELIAKIDESILARGDQFIKRDGNAIDCTLCEKEINYTETSIRGRIKQHCKTVYHANNIKEAGLTQIWNTHEDNQFTSPPNTPVRNGSNGHGSNGHGSNGRDGIDNEDNVSNASSVIKIVRKRAEVGGYKVPSPTILVTPVGGDTVDNVIGEANRENDTNQDESTELATDALNCSSPDKPLPEEPEESEFSYDSEEDLAEDDVEIELKMRTIEKLKEQTVVYKKVGHGIDTMLLLIQMFFGFLAIAAVIGVGALWMKSD